MSRDKEEKEAWGRLAGLEAGSSGGGRICPAAARTTASSSRGLQTYRTSMQWASYSAATDGPEMDLVEVWRSSTWSPPGPCLRRGEILIKGGRRKGNPGRMTGDG